MTQIRLKNRFGRRYMSLQELRNYVVDLDLQEHPPSEAFFEFLERESLVSPILRLRFPPAVLRRFEMEDNRSKSVVGATEPDGKRWTAAFDTFQSTDLTRWNAPYVYGEDIHPLDALIDQGETPFVQTDFDGKNFVPWKRVRATVGEYRGRPLYSDPRYTPGYYHYWQVFWVATALRGCMRLHLPLDDEAIMRAAFEGKLTEPVIRRTHRTLDLTARHHLKELREYRTHFDAIGYFEAYRNHALNAHLSNRDPETGRLTLSASISYRKREREIAHQSLRSFDLRPRQLMKFIRQQTRWWNETSRRGPAKVADEYKRNLASSIACYRIVTRRTLENVVNQVGHQGRRRPALDDIFPDWVQDQRELTIRSLQRWANVHLSGLPPPFPVNETDLEEFCDWLEGAGLYQYYWHFKRLVDIGKNDGGIHRAGTAAEAVGFANICEMIANRALEDRGERARGRTLGRKIRILFGPRGPIDLTRHLDRHQRLTSTGQQSLAQRRAQIQRLRRGGNYASVVRSVLDLWVIRNEGAHLGLLRYERAEIVGMIESMSMASLVIWRSGQAQPAFP